MKESAVFGINVGIGATTAAVRAWRGHRPIVAALWRGAFGGGVMGGGFALGQTQVRARRLLSVQTVAIGASMTSNAGAGRRLLSQVTLPFSPLVVEIRRPPTAGGVRARVRLSAAALTGVAVRLASPASMRVDWHQTVASGGIVFRSASPAYLRGGACPAEAECVRAGDQLLGTIAYSTRARDDHAIRATLSHEQMHVAQHARDLVLFGIPAGDALLGRSGRAGRAIRSVITLDYMLPLSAVSLTTGEANGTQHSAWFEVEARAFAPGSAPTFGGLTRASP